MGFQGSCTEDIKHRIGKALGAFQSIKDILASKDIKTATKIKLYQTPILSILMYGSETGTMKKEDENRLLLFEMTCLRKIMGVSRLDRIRNTIIRETLGLKYMYDSIETISQKRLRYYGHVMRMDPQRLPYITLNGMVHGERQRGKPVKRWLDGIKNDIKLLNITSLAEASRVAQIREKWKEVVQRISSLNIVGADAIK